MTTFYSFYNESTVSFLVFEAETGEQANHLASDNGIIFENTCTCDCCSNEVYAYDVDEQGADFEEQFEGLQETTENCPDYVCYFLNGSVKNYVRSN